MFVYSFIALVNLHAGFLLGFPQTQAGVKVGRNSGPYIDIVGMCSSVIT